MHRSVHCDCHIPSSNRNGSGARLPVSRGRRYTRRAHIMSRNKWDCSTTPVASERRVPKDQSQTKIQRIWGRPGRGRLVVSLRRPSQPGIVVVLFFDIPKWKKNCTKSVVKSIENREKPIFPMQLTMSILPWVERPIERAFLVWCCCAPFRICWIDPDEYRRITPMSTMWLP